MPVRGDAIADKVLEFCTLQLSWHHLALGEGVKGGGVTDLPTEFDARDRGLQIVGVTQKLCLDLNRVERVGARQTDSTSTLGTHDAGGHRPRTARWLEPGWRFTAFDPNLAYA